MGLSCTGSREAWFYMTEHGHNINMSDPACERNSRPIVTLLRGQGLEWLLSFGSFISTSLDPSVLTIHVYLSKHLKHCPHEHWMRMSRRICWDLNISDGMYFATNIARYKGNFKKFSQLVQTSFILWIVHDILWMKLHFLRAQDMPTARFMSNFENLDK